MPVDEGDTAVAAQFTRMSGEACAKRREPKQFVAIALRKAFLQRAENRRAA